MFNCTIIESPFSSSDRHLGTPSQALAHPTKCIDPVRHHGRSGRGQGGWVRRLVALRLGLSTQTPRSREVENKKVVHFVEDDSPISSKELGNFSELEDPGQSSASRWDLCVSRYKIFPIFNYSNPLGGTSKRDGDHKRIGQPVDR